MNRESAARTSPWTYGWAVLAAIASVAAAIWLRPTLQLASSLVLLFATALCARYGGLGPSVLATVLSTLAFRYYFLDPLHSLSFTSLVGTVRIGVYLVTAGMILAYMLSLRRRATDATEALDSLPGGVMLVGKNGSVLFANRCALEMLSRKQGDMNGKRLSEALPHWAGTSLFQEIERALSAPSPTRIEAGLGGESDLWFEIHVLDPGRMVSLFIRRGKGTGPAEPVVAAVTESESGHSVHDLRQSLGVITNYAELIRRSSEGQIEHYSKKVIESARHLATLLQDFSGKGGHGRSGSGANPGSARSLGQPAQTPKPPAIEDEEDLVESSRGR